MWAQSDAIRRLACCSLSTLLLLGLLKIELKLFALKDVAIAAARLSRAGGNAGHDSTGVELIGDLLIDDSVLDSLLDLGSYVAGLLPLIPGFVALLNLLLVQLDIVVLKIPHSEWVSINGNNAVLDKGLGSDELVVRSVVHNIQHSGLSCDVLGCPGEDTVIDFEGTPFHVGTSASNWSNSVGSNLSHGWLSTHFKLSLLLVNWHATTSRSSLVS